MVNPVRISPLTARLRPFRSSLRGSTGLGACLGACLVGGLLSDAALASPQQPTVTAGQSTITQSGTTTTVHQTTNQSVINWQSFSVAPNEQVIFQQPNAVSISLDRVIGGSASTIAGALSANGRVFLINANGVLFAPGATVNLAGLIATTSDIADSDFMAGKFAFGQASANTSATVVNQGTIDVSTGGFAILSAAAVANTGVIRAKLGQVVLAGATAFTMDFDGDGLLQYAVTQGVGTNPGTSTLVEQSGTIAAEGGQVLLTAQAAKGIIQHAINMDGMTEANAVARSANGTLIVGAVTLDGGSSGAVEVTGSIQAANSAGPGGTVQVLGENVSLTGAGTIQAWGSTGGGTVLFGGNEHGAGPQADASSAYVAAGTTITANATATGNGGKVVVWSNDATGFAGTINVEGGAGGGNGGFVETSGKNYLDASGLVTAGAAHGVSGTWLLDPSDITIANNGGVTTGGTFSGGMYFAGSGSMSTIDPSNITSALNVGTNVNISASGGSGGSGNITVTSPITMDAASSTTIATLSLTSFPGGMISINAPIGASSGALGLELQGSVSINANVNANYAFIATGNLSTDTFTQAPGTTITSGPGGFTVTYESVALTSVQSSNPYSAATIQPYYSATALGIGTGTGLVSGSGALVLSSQTLSALTGFYTINIGASSLNSIVFGGTVNFPMASQIFFNAGSAITVQPGAQLNFQTLPYGTIGSSIIQPTVSFASLSTGTLTIGSSAALNLGDTELLLNFDHYNLPSTSVFANSAVNARVTLDAASSGAQLGIGDGATGDVLISSAALAAFDKFPGVLWLGAFSTSAVDVAGFVSLPTQTSIGPSYTNGGSNPTAISIESSAVLNTSATIATGTQYAGLNLVTSSGGMIVENPGAKVVVGAGTLFLSTDNLLLNGGAGANTAPAFSITSAGYGTIAVGNGKGTLTVTQQDLDSLSGSGTAPHLFINNLSSIGGIEIDGPVSLSMATNFYSGYGAPITVNGALTGASSVVFAFGYGGTFVESSGASISGTAVGVQGGTGSAITIDGSITATAFELEAASPGQNAYQQGTSASYGYGPTGAGTIALGPMASIIVNTPLINVPGLAETLLYAPPGGSITIAQGATINFSGGNLALITDNLSVLSSPGAISGASRVIISPASSDGYLMGPFDTVLSPSLFAAEGVSSPSISIGTNLDPGSWNVSQSLIDALSTNAGRLQIGALDNTAEIRVAGPLNFSAETEFFAGDVLIDSTASIKVTGTTTIDDPTGASTPNGLLIFTAWDGQFGDAVLGTLELSNHGNIGILPGAVIDVAGIFQLVSLQNCSSCGPYHPIVLLDGTITASSILYTDSAVGANVFVGPNAVLTATGSGGIQFSPDIGGSITLIGGASLNSGPGALTLTTDSLNLGFNGNLVINDYNNTTTTFNIPISGSGSIAIGGVGVIVDTAESADGLSGSTVGVNGATGTLQLSSPLILALSETAPLEVGDIRTNVNFGTSTIAGPVFFINGCEEGASCGSGASGSTSTSTSSSSSGGGGTGTGTGTGSTSQTTTALKQVAALAGTIPSLALNNPNPQSGLESLDLAGLGLGGVKEQTGGGGVPGSSAAGSSSGSSSGEAASGPKPAQPTVLLPGKLVSFPPRPPIDSGIPGLNGENSSLGNSVLW